MEQLLEKEGSDDDEDSDADSVLQEVEKSALSGGACLTIPVAAQTVVKPSVTAPKMLDPGEFLRAFPT